MKKLSLFLLLALLLALMFTVSCGSTNTPSETTAASTSSAESSGVSTTTTAPITTAATTATVTTQVPNTTSKPTVTAEPVKLMTFNLRYDITSHSLMSLDVRGKHLMEIVKKYDLDSISFCEATNNWMNYLRKEMPKLGYSGVGVGRDSGKTGGSGNGNEHSPIFYKTDKYDLLESDTFWISATPEVTGSKSWGTSIKRICTYAVLKNKETGAIYAHFGTHLDHKSAEARQNAVLVIESYIREVYQKYGDIGIVLSGDFNDSMQSNTYLSLVSFLDDSRSIAKKKLVTGATTNGYRPDAWESSYANKTPVVGTSSPIDYIFLGKKTATVSVYTVVNDYFTFEHEGKTWHNHPVSDHYGVYCEATFTSPSSSMTYDEKKIVTHRASFAPSQTLPSSYEGLTVINDLFSISTTLNAAKPIENLLINDSSTSSVLVSGNKHGVWEITLSVDAVTEIHGLSFTTGNSKNRHPHTLRVYISNDGATWKRLGDTYSEDLTASTTYYLSTPSPLVRTQYIKFVFSDCPNGAELVNLTVYGK